MDIIEKLGVSKYPWKAVRDDCHFDSISDIVDSDNKLIGQSTGYSVEIMQKDCILMASAPEVLEALIWLMNGVDNMPHVTALENIVSHQWADSCDAIKKATGKTWEEIKELINE